MQRSSHWARASRLGQRSALFGCAFALLLAARPAKADVSSWAFVGGGVANLKQNALSDRTVGAMRLHIGLGSDPSHFLVVGGILSLEPNFGYGSDLSESLRLATRGYVNGGLGLALDLGPYERAWGQGSVGGAGTLWLGAPWGVSLGLGASAGSHDAHGFSAILGVDFARLTIYRNSGTSWFLNPYPAYRPQN